jgi:Tfp pilus assembly protein PilF
MSCWARLALAAACCLGAATARAQSFVPASDGEVVERLPLAPLDPTVQRARRLRAELAARPDDLGRATRLAWLYIEQGRALSDPRFFGYAQGVLAPWWSAAAPPSAVLLLRATLRQHDHDFAAALSDLQQLLRVDPENAQAWLTQAVVQQVRGEYAAARASCLAVRAQPLVTVTCVSAVDSLSGHADRAYAALRRALAEAAGADGASRRWALTTLGEIAARRGDGAAADDHFRQALAGGEGDDYLLSAYADFLLDQDRATAVRTLLQGRAGSDALLLRLAIAEQRLGAAEAAMHVRTLRDRFAAARRRGDVVHRREEARFTLTVLGDAATALDLARANWTVQREPADARVLLDAALAAGDAAAARPVLDFLAASGLDDAALRQPLRALAAAS